MLGDASKGDQMNAICLLRRSPGVFFGAQRGGRGRACSACLIKMRRFFLFFVLAVLAIGAFAQNCLSVTVRPSIYLLSSSDLFFPQCVQEGDACDVVAHTNEARMCEDSTCSQTDLTCHPAAGFGDVW